MLRRHLGEYGIRATATNRCGNITRKVSSLVRSADTAGVVAHTTNPHTVFCDATGDSAFIQSADTTDIHACTNAAQYREYHTATADCAFIDTSHSTDIVPAAEIACGKSHILHRGTLGYGSKEPTVVSACLRLSRLEHGDDMAATIEGSLEGYAVICTDRYPRQLHIAISNEVVVKTDIGPWMTVVHKVCYPIEVAEILDDKDAVVAIKRLHFRLLTWMQTVLTGADAIRIEIVTDTRFVKECLVIALATGISHDGALTFSRLYRTVIGVIVREFLEVST